MASVRGLGRVFQHPGSARWWVGYNVNGVEHRESSGSMAKEDAVALLKSRLAQQTRGEFVAPQRRLTVGALIDALETDHVLNGHRSMRPWRSHAN